MKGAKRGGDGGPYGGAGDYSAAAEKHNLLLFRYRLDWVQSSDDETEGGTNASSDGSSTNRRRGGRLVPGSAVLVARRAVSIDSSIPTELGHAYGWPYWEGQLADQVRWG